MSSFINKFILKNPEIAEKKKQSIHCQKIYSYIPVSEASLRLPEKYQHIVNYPDKCEMQARRFM